MDRLKTLLEFLEEDPSDAFTRFAVAQEYAKRGDVQRALEYYEALVREQPSYVGTYYHLAKLYEEVGRTADAKRIYRDGIAEAEKQRDFHSRAELNNALLQLEGLGWDDV